MTKPSPKVRVVEDLDGDKKRSPKVRAMQERVTATRIRAAVENLDSDDKETAERARQTIDSTARRAWSGAAVIGATRTRKERSEALKAVLVKAIKDEAHNNPHNNWWDDQKFRRHHVCKTWLVDHVPDEAIDLFKGKKGESLSLRTLLTHTNALANWTRAEFEAEVDDPNVNRYRAEKAKVDDSNVKRYRAEKVKRQHPRREG